MSICSWKRFITPDVKKHHVWTWAPGHRCGGTITEPWFLGSSRVTRDSDSDTSAKHQGAFQVNSTGFIKGQ